MKSKYSEYFNHDDDAENYDLDVLNEDHPVRKGYSALLEYTGRQVQKNTTVIDLGCGTGNTILQLPECKKIYAVDVSEKMIQIAKQKLNKRNEIEYVTSDILEFVSSFDVKVDAIVSTYVLHHLDQTEKHQSFLFMKNLVKKGGKLIIGDLMFKNIEHEKQMRMKYPDLCEDFDDEFFWNIKTDSRVLEDLGFTISKKQFSDLSFVIIGIRNEG